jgi:4-amino-4-deoxy-L-arabinose transferase-like glycosyltransferase
MKRVFSHPLCALAAGLALRLYFLLVYPQTSGDTAFYEQFAENWLKHGTYAMNVGGVLTPIDIRVPGYPAYLALVYAITGRTGEAARLWVMLGQAALDLLTCIVIAALAALLVFACAPTGKPRRAFRIALWLAALCPFTANYVAVPLTETFAFFFTSLALLLMCILFLHFRGSPLPSIAEQMWISSRAPALVGAIGLVVGVGTLFRPETPLLLAVMWIVALPYLLSRRQIRRAAQLVLISGAACILPLLPWGIRNAITLHEFQFLAPEYSAIPGEFVPYGFMKWERTWLIRFRDVYLVSWNLNDSDINLDDIPSYAFDSAQEKQKVAALLDEYNETHLLTPEEDAAFGEIGRERTARHPLRTFLFVPFLRVFTLWFTPRIEMLPFSGQLWPPAQAWNTDPVDMSVTISFFLLNIVYVFLGIWGGWRLWRSGTGARWALLFFLLYVVLRTAFLTTLETPEPRYVLECYPILLALAAILFTLKPATKPARSSLTDPLPARDES